MERAYNTCLEMIQQRKYEIINQKKDQIVALKPDGNQIMFSFDSLNLMSKIFNVYNNNG